MSRKFLSSAALAAKDVVFVDGARIPFSLANTIYKDLLAVDLGRLALKVRHIMNT